MQKFVLFVERPVQPQTRGPAVSGQMGSHAAGWSLDCQHDHFRVEVDD